MTLEWFKLTSADWILRLVDGTRLLISLGTLHAVGDEYVVFPIMPPGDDLVAPCYLPADLTLDEVKSAAKLILATGRTYGQE